MTSIEKAILYEVSLFPPAPLTGRARIMTTLFEQNASCNRHVVILMLRILHATKPDLDIAFIADMIRIYNDIVADIIPFSEKILMFDSKTVEPR